MAEMINAYFLRSTPGRQYKGYMGQIENTLKAHQAYVGGLIQAVHISSEIIVICNDEGKIQHLPLNRAWIDSSQEVLDYFAGNILCVRSNGDEFASIEPEDIPIIEQCLIPLKAMFRARDHTAFLMYPAKFCPEWHK